MQHAKHPGAAPETIERNRPAILEPARNLLVVDDDSSVRSLIKSLLEMEGFQAVEAASGDDAMGLLAHVEVDMLITDIEMPGTDGIELARAVRRDCWQMPILIMSAMSAMESEDLVRSLGDRCFFLQKPFSIADLIAIVQQAVAVQSTCAESTENSC
jgi:two-component system, cell cycle sensor histidine kinase and response regulator CckA